MSPAPSSAVGRCVRTSAARSIDRVRDPAHPLGQAGRVVTSESLLRQAWDAREPTDTERVRAFVKQIHAKLGDSAARPTWIFDERGVGYRMAKPGEAWGRPRCRLRSAPDRNRDRRPPPCIACRRALRPSRSASAAAGRHRKTR